MTPQRRILILGAANVGTALRVALDPADEAVQSDTALADWLRAAGIPVEASRRPAPTLDDVFGALSETTP